MTKLYPKNSFIKDVWQIFKVPEYASVWGFSSKNYLINGIKLKNVTLQCMFSTKRSHILKQTWSPQSIMVSSGSHFCIKGQKCSNVITLSYLRSTKGWRIGFQKSQPTCSLNSGKYGHIVSSRTSANMSTVFIVWFKVSIKPKILWKNG